MCPNDLCQDCINLPPLHSHAHLPTSVNFVQLIRTWLARPAGPRQKMSRRRHAHWALHRQISSCKKNVSKMFTSKTSFVSISIVTRPLSLIIYAFWIWSLRNKIMHRISMFSLWDTKCPWNALLCIYIYIYIDTVSFLAVLGVLLGCPGTEVRIRG